MFTQGGSNLTFVNGHASKDSIFFQQTFVKHLLCAKHFSPVNTSPCEKYVNKYWQ